MTKMMQEAIEALRDLPDERQNTIARAILDYAADDDGVYHLPMQSAPKSKLASQKSSAERLQAIRK